MSVHVGDRVELITRQFVDGVGFAALTNDPETGNVVVRWRDAPTIGEVVEVLPDGVCRVRLDDGQIWDVEAAEAERARA